MSAIEGATVKVGTLVDGTLRVTIDFPPAVRNDAFALFGGPGTAVAVAALRDGHALKSDSPAEPKGGPLSQWLAQRCNEVAFREWVWQAVPLCGPEPTCDEASDSICGYIGVNRKREIDGDRHAPTNLKTLVMKPYSDWLKKRGAA